MSSFAGSLLPPDALVHTGPVDHADWNYRGVVGWVSRQRFKMIERLLPDRVDRLLEIGYGSGVFMPSLARHASELYGIDVHEHNADVQAVLAQHGVTASLSTGDAARLPYEDGSFDAIVAVSSLEFVVDLGAAAAEMRRVLAPGGMLVMVMPGTSPLLDLLLRLATSESATTDYGDRRQRTLPTLLAQFRIDRRIAFPSPIGGLLPVYHAYRLLANPPPASTQHP